jgi:hypothetical protein
LRLALIGYQAVIRLRVFYLTFALILTCSPGFSAELKPPIATLLKAGVLVEVTWIESTLTHMVVQIDRCISGCDDTRTGTMTIQADPNVITSGLIGERYLLNFSDAIKAFNTAPKTFGRAVSAARLTEIEGATPALFRLNKSTSDLFKPKAAMLPLSLVLSGLDHFDPHIADLWSAELAYEARYLANMSDKTRLKIASAVRNPALRTQSRMRLLEVLNTHAPKLALELAGEIIQLHPKIDGSISAAAGLINTAFVVIQREPKFLKVRDYRRWLSADQLSIAETAIISIRAVDPNDEQKEVDYLLSQTFVSPAGRVFFRDHLRRLNLMRGESTVLDAK